MSELKKFREIDARNSLYGSYKYQVRLGRMKLNSREVITWCDDRWGSQRQWIQDDRGFGYTTYNPQWRIVRKSRTTTPILYLKGDAEAMMFGLVWGA